MGIPVSDRHRANGDAIATTKLFKMLLAKDSGKTIIQSAIKAENSSMQPKLLDIIEQLPTSTGVYYIHKEDGSIIYIGKSKNIKKRVNQHFTAVTKKARNIQREVVAVTYEETGNELIALLKESQEIKTNKPIYNRAQRRTLFTYALYKKVGENGYSSFSIEKIDGRKSAITTFTSFEEGKKFLFSITENYNLCQKINGLYNLKSSCFQYQTNTCFGACVNKETPKLYNERAMLAETTISFKQQSLMIIDKGRDIDERSVILIENGNYKGFGFYNLNYQINNIDVIKSVITPMHHNRDTQYIIQAYLRKKKVLKVVNF